MRFKDWRPALVLTVAIIAASLWLTFQLFTHAPALTVGSTNFFVEPYLQLGAEGDVHKPHVLWADRQGGKWNLEVSTSEGAWSPAATISNRLVNLPNIPPFRIYEATLPALPEGVAVPYRVTRDGTVLFTATINAVKAAGDYRIDVVGDIANDSPGERQIAAELFASKPDMVVIPGDIVYAHGRTLEYMHHFFPVYNADTATGNGVPLLRSTLFAAAPGNHDTAVGSRFDARDLGILPDAQAYFLWWRQPLNGPDGSALGSHQPQMRGPQANVEAFLKAAGDAYPRQENFSFNYGNSHWVVIDGNDYMDWSDRKLRQWLIDDLDKAKDSIWKFVVFHQPPFNSDRHHFEDQQLRAIADVFQDHGVDIAFGGHVHGYQRTHPLRFTLTPLPDGNWREPSGVAPGKLQLDKAYDGVKNTHAHGVLYVITAGGGAVLTGKEEEGHPERWQPFTAKFINQHSFTQCDFKGKHLQVRQIGPGGQTLDEFGLDK